MTLATVTLWIEAAVIALGHIFLSHSEERTSKWRKTGKLFGSIGVAVLTSATSGRVSFVASPGLLSRDVLDAHAKWLPRRGGNGWTGGPKAKHYALQG